MKDESNREIKESMSLIDIDESTKKAEIVSQVSYLQSSPAPIDVKAEDG